MRAAKFSNQKHFEPCDKLIFAKTAVVLQHKRKNLQTIKHFDSDCFLRP